MALLDGVLSFIGGSMAQHSNEDIADQNRDFQKAMSDTSYQRAVKDLAAAGLNPMLAYMHGGASTPAGSTANIQDAITPAVNSARAADQVTSNVSVQKAQIADITASAGLKTAQTDESQAKTAEAQSQAALNQEMAKRAAQETITSGTTASLNQANEAHVREQIKAIAPQIAETVSRTNLNDASKNKLVSELPLIAAQVVKTKAETEESYQRRLLDNVRMQIEALKRGEGVAMNNFWTSEYGKASPYINSGTKAAGNITGSLSPWAWLLKR